MGNPHGPSHQSWETSLVPGPTTAWGGSRTADRGSQGSLVSSSSMEPRICLMRNQTARLAPLRFQKCSPAPDSLPGTRRETPIHTGLSLTKGQVLLCFQSFPVSVLSPSLCQRGTFWGGPPCHLHRQAIAHSGLSGNETDGVSPEVNIRSNGHHVGTTLQHLLNAPQGGSSRPPSKAVSWQNVHTTARKHHPFLAQAHNLWEMMSTVCLRGEGHLRIALQAQGAQPWTVTGQGQIF